MLCLVYFNVQPPLNRHACDRSRFLGSLLLLFNKLMGLPLLAVGVYIKFVIEADIDNESNALFASRLLAFGVGSSLVLLLGMRLCHFGGIVPRASDSPEVSRLIWIWWFTFGIFSVLPFCFVGVQSVAAGFSIQCGLLLLLTFLESWFMHAIEGMQNEQEATAAARTPLLSEEQDQESYESLEDNERRFI